MSTTKLFTPTKRRCLLLLFIAMLTSTACGICAYLVQTDGGRVKVDIIRLENPDGKRIAAKLYRPNAQNAVFPGILFLHGHQSCKETSDLYAIELARRGFIVLSIDLIGRGNSDCDLDGKDPTAGAAAALRYLRGLDNVSVIGLAGHSLGARIAYDLALKDPAIKALLITGNAYTAEASKQTPKNMLMIFGQYDEFRTRMTQTSSFAKEWMNRAETRRVFPVANPVFGEVYGSFTDYSARSVYMPKIVHLLETLDTSAIAVSLRWMRAALDPDKRFWIEPEKQTAHLKEFVSLLAMLAALFSLFPLSLLLLDLPFFQPIRSPAGPQPLADRAGKGIWIKSGLFNALAAWLYLPSILLMFGIHKYLVRLDIIFPAMTATAIVFWFLLTNLLGFFLIRRWMKKRQLSPTELGLFTDSATRGNNNSLRIRYFLAALILFLWIYLLEWLGEKLFLLDFRFIFSYASDLTLYRLGIFLIYLPFLYLAFYFQNLFLYGRLPLASSTHRVQALILDNLARYLVSIVPTLSFLALQYVPLLCFDRLLLSGPGGMFAYLTMNLFHVMGILLIVIPISSWFFSKTNKIYLGTTLNALLVTWMLISSQVIAPIPI